MKLITIFFFFLILTCISLKKKSKQSNETNSNSNSNYTDPGSKISKPVNQKKTKNEFARENTIGAPEVYNKIRGYIDEFAKTSMSQTNVKLKKKLVGALGENFPPELKNLAKKRHAEANRWKNIMVMPVKIYKFCLFPSFDYNYSTWCEEKYAMKSKSNLMNCYNTFCLVCCDNLQILLKNIADNNIMGDKLGLDKESGFKLISEVVTEDDIHQCRKECKINFPVKYPKPNLSVPRDPKLGKWSDFPAKSCADIKKWGAEENDSGSYWIDFGGKIGKSQVYCDMNTNRGGWTLFFNYMHLPNSDLKIQEGKFPSTLKDNSHIKLNKADLTELDVKELRFFCTEKSTEKTYWHFTTDSPKMINVAFDSNQKSIDLEELKTTYTDLMFPGNVILWNKAFNFDSIIDDLNYTGGNSNGNFFDKPFGSKSKNKYWIVKGDNPLSFQYNCGTNHKNESDSASAYTHHTIFFRGDPPSEDFARQRYYNKEIKKINQENLSKNVEKK